MCLMNMFLHNIGEIDKDSLISPNDALIAPSPITVDYVLANPPFGKKSSMSFTNEDGRTIIYEPNKGSAVAGQTTFDLSRPMTYSDANKVCDLKKLTPHANLKMIQISPLSIIYP